MTSHVTSSSTSSPSLAFEGVIVWPPSSALGTSMIVSELCSLLLKGRFSVGGDGDLPPRRLERRVEDTEGLLLCRVEFLPSCVGDDNVFVLEAATSSKYSSMAPFNNRCSVAFALRFSASRT